jgi:DNA modification methylase
MPKQTDLFEYSPIATEEKEKLRGEIHPLIKGDIPISHVYGGRLLEVYSKDRSSYTHGFHKYPAKYIPEIPRWAILKFSEKGNIVIDPFCGSGTTNVEARLHERHSYAIDVDPVALLLTKVKATPLDYQKLLRVKNKLLRTIYSEQERDLPDFPNRDYWFRSKVLEDLSTISASIKNIEDSDIRDFFIVCFSSILKEVSNADPKFLYALAISRKMREQNNRKIDAKKTFVARVNNLTPKMVMFSKKCPKEYFLKIIGKDAKDIQLADESVDLAVTSPPYLNAVDYTRANQLQLYWFGLWKGKLTDLKKLYIGTEQINAEQYEKLAKYGNPALDKILESIYEIDKKRSYVVFKYFADMRNNFKEIKRVLKPRQHYCVAVADNLVRKISVPTHAVLMDIAQEVGFKTVDYFASALMMRPHDMRKTEKMNAEWVMAFQKED